MKTFITNQKSIAPLAVFRALFGFIMLVSIIRFAANGWIYELYIQPEFYFSYYGFDWVAPLGSFGMYAIFGIMGLAALFIMLGYYYRVATVLFFLAFTYVELIDKTNYLNHYYFVSIISFLLMLVPAHRSFSLDILRKPEWKVDKVPAWTINIFILQLGIVYFYAGIAKLNPDWLFHALPMKIWLPANAHLPLIGWLLEYEATAYLFSWAGALYDLTIVFFLLYKPTRYVAYAAVVIFHLFTWVLFPIGMFPYIMILCTLIFFSAEFHEHLIAKAKQLWTAIGFKLSKRPKKHGAYNLSKGASSILTIFLVMYFTLQLLVPLRFAAYPGDLFWTEQGYRFSWRVMLMEKAGYATFNVQNPKNGKSWEVANYNYLTPNQEKMMATQPDMILQFAHYLENEYQKQGISDVEITVETYVTLNGRHSRMLIDPQKDLTKIDRGFANKQWITPYPDKQKSWFGSKSK